MREEPTSYVKLHAIGTCTGQQLVKASSFKLQASSFKLQAAGSPAGFFKKDKKI